MDAIIKKSKSAPENIKITAPPSKSYAHRILICAALADEISEITLPELSEDTSATIRALTALGADFEINGEIVKVNPISDNSTLEKNVDCGESGSTLRFLLPVAAALGKNAVFIGRGRLPERPISQLVSELENHGVQTVCMADSPEKNLPLKISGKMKGGEFTIAGNISSQFASGLIMALPLCGGGKIILTGNIESVPYIDMTISTVNQFGVRAYRKNNIIEVSGGIYKSQKIAVEGDWSNAAFFLSLGAIYKPVSVTGLNFNSTQGDKAIIDLLKRFGAEIVINDESITVSPADLSGIEIDASEIPDLIPIASAVAAASKGVTRIYNAGRLRLKESDRLKAVHDMLSGFGIKVTEKSDELIIFGSESEREVQNINIDGYNDHRIVMSASILSSIYNNELKISTAQAINKSYPRFFEDLSKTGIIADFI